jgi:hypothetical protein
MGKIIDPRPPQWERKQPVDDVKEDRVLRTADALLQVLTGETDPTVVQLAALRLVQKAVIGTYQSAMGLDNTKEVLKQATEMASCYVITGVVDGDNDHGK